MAVRLVLDTHRCADLCRGNLQALEIIEAGAGKSGGLRFCRPPRSFIIQNSAFIIFSLASDCA